MILVRFITSSILRDSGSDGSMRWRTGVRNLRNLSTTISQQKLAYEFPFSSFDLETDLGFVVLSEGKAFIPVRTPFRIQFKSLGYLAELFPKDAIQTDCVVYVEPSKQSTTPVSPSKEKLSSFRSFIHSTKHSSFSIPPTMSDVRLL